MFEANSKLIKWKNVDDIDLKNHVIFAEYNEITIASGSIGLVKWRTAVPEDIEYGKVYEFEGIRYKFNDDDEVMFCLNDLKELGID